MSSLNVTLFVRAVVMATRKYSTCSGPQGASIGWASLAYVTDVIGDLVC